MSRAVSWAVATLTVPYLVVCAARRSGQLNAGEHSLCSREYSKSIALADKCVQHANNRIQTCTRYTIVEALFVAYVVVVLVLPLKVFRLLGSKSVLRYIGL